MTDLATTTAQPTALALAMPAESPIIEHAIKAGASADQLLQIVQAQVAMNNHQLELLRQKREWDREDRAIAAKVAYDEAMVLFKAACPNVLRLKEIKDGPQAGKKHADLDEVVATATEHLSNNGLACTWRVIADEKEWITVEARLQHKAGHVETNRFSCAPDTTGSKNSIQARKSAVTYLERITMLLVCGLAEADADDDGAGGEPPAEGDAAAKVLLADLMVLISGLKDDAAIVALWSKRNGELSQHPALHAQLKAHVKTRRKQLEQPAAAQPQGAPA